MHGRFRRVDEFLESGGWAVDATLGVGIVLFGCGPQLVPGWWSHGVPGAVVTFLMVVSASWWWIRNTELTAAEYLTRLFR